jgi:hypothetical protein
VTSCLNVEFHFELRPLEAALRWRGDRPSWFSLSDGWFWVTLGDDEVFRVDYQVDRFWEEVCEFAPKVLRPVPPDLVPFVESDPEDWADVESDASWSAQLWHLGYRMFRTEGLRGWLTGSDFTIVWIRDGSETRVTLSEERFRATVRDFDARYRGAMLDRVAELQRDYPEVAANNAGAHAEDAALHANRLEREFALPPLEETADLEVVRAGAAELSTIGLS